jgi:predicted ABC-type transport system involved in lysophospholipase L1 biosynthesis ATPase subunit
MLRSGVMGWFGVRKEARERSAATLDSLGLGDRLRHKPPQLSGGERQRVAIARALVSDPSVLLCDEPTGNLDERTSAGIIELLMEINRDKAQTMVLVTHNDSLADCAGRLVRLKGGILAPEKS